MNRSIHLLLYHVVEFKVIYGPHRVFAVVQRYVEPLIAAGPTFIQHVANTASNEQCRIIFLTNYNWVVIAIAVVAQCKIQFSNTIRHACVEIVQAFIEFFIAFAMQHGEMIVVC